MRDQEKCSEATIARADGVVMVKKRLLSTLHE